MKQSVILASMLVGGSAMLSLAQSVGTITQTVNQRNTALSPQRPPAASLPEAQFPLLMF
jgi:hypothetical protein